MPWKTTVKRAREDKREGKAPTTQAGEFVREEMEHIRRGKHGARSPKQAIAIALNKARRSGVNLKPPAKGRTSEKTRASAEGAYKKGQAGAPRPSRRRSEARERVLKREPRSAASRPALSRQAKQAARARGAGSRRRAAAKAVRTKGQRQRKAA
jgi:hypothetical protein